MILWLVVPFVESIGEGTSYDEVIGEFLAADNKPTGSIESFHLFTGEAWKHWNQRDKGMAGLSDFHKNMLVLLAEQSHSLISLIDQHFKAAGRLIDICERELAARDSDLWNSQKISKAHKAADAARHIAVEHLRQVRYFQRQAAWLIERFPEAQFVAVSGLCRIVPRDEIKTADWSLTPSRYVGVAPPEVDKDFDFEQAMRDIHIELADLNQEATKLAAKIQENFEELI
jgi:type I restriction enzyme M protein